MIRGPGWERGFQQCLRPSGRQCPFRALSVCRANLPLQMRQPRQFLERECEPASGLSQEACVVTQCSQRWGGLGERWCGCESSSIILMCIGRDAPFGLFLWLCCCCCLGVFRCPVFPNPSAVPNVCDRCACSSCKHHLGSRPRSSTCAGFPISSPPGMTDGMVLSRGPPPEGAPSKCFYHCISLILRCNVFHS